MARLRALLVWFWNIAARPSAHFGLAFLALGGFVCGIMFWGAFNTALELTNTEKFCTGCHEMHDNVYQELQRTVHFSNRSGVRATCPDCHVPHDWTDKIARKMQASKEVWGKVVGTISTRVDGKETRWRYREGYDPFVKAGKGVDFYGQPDGKARAIGRWGNYWGGG